MAATDRPYRDQYMLDIVFAVSCLAMLFAVLWMFVDDYNAEWKTDQRAFFDVKAELAMRQALEQMPDPDEVDRADQEVSRARKARNPERIAEIKSEIAVIQPHKERSEAQYQSIKASLESRTSFFNAAKQHGHETLAEGYLDEIRKLEADLNKAAIEKDKYAAQLRAKQNKLIDQEKLLNEAIAKVKALNDKFDALIRLAVKSQYGIGARIRSWPILDGFASPYKIQQVTNNDIPIDYNFKYVTRFDRCMTCHQGIDQPAFTRENLAELRDIPGPVAERLVKARKLLEKRRAALEGMTEQLRLMPEPADLDVNPIPRERLSDSRVTEFSAHPRLDLFVGPNSKHSAEKFGCSACHAGQGSATSFVLAAHTPNDSREKQRWIKEYHWHYEAHHGNFLWDFPMLPRRFIESSCLKCHHQVTDLVTSDNRNEAPKLIRGFNLVKENGCFGCHEIAGRKAARSIGPDLRLEPYPSREELTPAELVKLDEDPDKAPGTMRKVGPSLFRLAEKTNREWTAKWIRAPREFRPDTKMPHFYMTSNNHPDVLPPEQKPFPDAEIYAVTEVLFKASRDYLDQVASSRKSAAKDSSLRTGLEQKLRGFDEKTEALTEQDKEELKETRKQLDELALRDRLRKSHEPLDAKAKVPAGNAERGRFLFTVKGCLACHAHQGVESASGKPGTETFLPPVVSEAQFGPDLSQVVAKLGQREGDAKSARVWLVHWVKDPHLHSPRSRMPVTHLSDQEAADLAEWLLSQKATRLGPSWESEGFWGNKEKHVARPELQALKDLARVYLIRKLPADQIEALQIGKDIPKAMFDGLPGEEQSLAKDLKQITQDADKKDERSYERFVHYVGRKAVTRLGCFGCHDIPGFENDKPIGTGLNDWGKKDPERLAFEDIRNFAKNHYHVVDRTVDKGGRPYGPIKENGVTKLPYEKFYHDSLMNKEREGYLHQKLLDPRSFDYRRRRAWDDLARMPQFAFARSRQGPKESSGDYDARVAKEEAEAREAVMTFVLGLVAEPIPEKVVNQPRGDRLAEVQGRQILDKYNCGGCHVVRAGVVEFKLDATVTARLIKAHTNNKETWIDDHPFLNHKKWQGKVPPPTDRVVVQGVNAAFSEEEEDDNPNLKIPSLKIRPTDAVTFAGPNGPLTIRPGPSTFVTLPVTGLLYPSKHIAENPERLRQFQRDQGPYGGAFTDLLVNFLVERDKPKSEQLYKRDPNTGVTMEASSAAPPLLIGQGERTQSDWLYGFLRDPTQIRRMTELTHGKDKAVLRMPKFNMSAEEAKALVNYFGAVERLTNPGIGLEPFDGMVAEEGIKSPYFVARNKEYVERMKQTVKDSDGKPIKNAQGKDTTFYHKRLEELRPIWEKVAQEAREKQKQIDAQYQAAKKRLDAATAADKAKSTDDTKRELQDAERIEKFLGAEAERLSELTAHGTVEEQEAAWREREAYLADGFRIVLDKNQTCMKCHEIGSFKTNNQVQGPPLDLSHKRLRGGWIEHWLANPPRMIYYTPMPMNFPANKNNFADFAGDSREQVRAARDILMVYPEAAALPINRYWALPLAGEKK